MDGLSDPDEFCKDGLIAGARDKKGSAAVPIRLTSSPASLVPPPFVDSMRDGEGIAVCASECDSTRPFPARLRHLLAN
jgi:hypothetical protein